MPLVRPSKQKRRGILLGQHSLLALRFGKQSGKALEPRRKLDRRRVRAACRAIEQRLVTLLSRQKSRVVEQRGRSRTRPKRFHKKRRVVLPVVERIEKRDDVRRLLPRERIVKSEEEALVIRIFLDGTQKEIESLRPSPFHRLDLAERGADEGKHLQRVIRAKRRGRLLPARHAAAEHLLRQQIVALLPCQKADLHGKLREVGILCHRLFQDGQNLFLRPLLSEQCAHESPIFRTFASHVDDLARNRLPRIFRCPREIAQAVIAIHIVQSIVHGFALRFFLLPQEVEVAFQFFAHEMK